MTTDVVEQMPPANIYSRSMLAVHRGAVGEADSLEWIRRNADGTYETVSTSGWVDYEVNVKDPAYGATGDGVTSDLAAFTAALLAVSVAGGGKVVVPRGTYAGLTNLPVPSNVTIEGAGIGVTILLTPDSPTNPILDVYEKHHVRIKGMSLGVGSGTASSRGYGIHVHGDSTDALIEDVWGDALQSTVQIGYGATDTADGLVQRATLRRVFGLNAPSTYGIVIEDCDRVTLESCHAAGNALDGYKIRRNARRVTLRDCNGIGNGIVGVGDGLDAYAGGNTLRILGGDWSENSGNGIVIKTDTLTATDSAQYGFVHKGGVRDATAHDNGGSGFAVYSYYSGPTPAPSPDAETDPTTPFAALYSLDNCHAEGNTNYGFYLNCFGLVASNCISIANGLDGFYLAPRSLYTTIRDQITMGNSRTTANTRYGVYIEDGAYFIRISGGTILGVYAEGVKTLAEIAALTKYHKANIYVADGADQVHIDGVMEAYSVSAQGIQTWGGSGKVQVVHHLPGLLNPSASYGGLGAFGGLGSTWTRSDAPLSSYVQWVKTSSLPNAPTAGWTLQTGHLLGSKTQDWASIANGAQATTTVTVTGAVLGDQAVASMSRDILAMHIMAHVSATNTVTVVMKNDTGAAVDLGSGTLYALVTKIV